MLLKPIRLPAECYDKYFAILMNSTKSKNGIEICMKDSIIKKESEKGELAKAG